MYSGRTHLRIHDEKHDDSDGDGDEADETKLSVRKLGQAAEGFAPGARCDQREQTLEHEHQSARGQEGFRHRSSFSRMKFYFAPGRFAPFAPLADCFRYWKNSEFGSRTSTSLLFRNVAL